MGSERASDVGTPDGEVKESPPCRQESAKGAQLLGGDVYFLVGIRPEDALEDDEALAVEVVVDLNVYIQAELVDAVLELDLGETLQRAWLW